MIALLGCGISLRRCLNEKCEFAALAVGTKPNSNSNRGSDMGSGIVSGTGPNEGSRMAPDIESV